VVLRQGFFTRVIAIQGLWIFLSFVSACGYRFSDDSSLIPKDVRTIYIEPFINRSRDVGVEKEMTSALRSEFYRKGQLRIVDEIEQADAILSGVVRSLDNHLASVNRRNESLQYQATMIVDVTLRRRNPEQVIWQGQGLQLNRVYAGSRAAVVTTSSDFKKGTLSAADVARLTDIQLTQGENKESRAELIAGFAEDLRQRLMEMF